jgi:3-oxoacyl-[acyl-carrier protein] reductase
MHTGLAGRVGVVTGAGRGIGRQVALDLAAEECRVVACARTADDLGALVDHAGSDLVVPLIVDVAETDAADRIVAAAVDRFGRLDVVINNAGGPAARRLDAMTDERWRSAFEVDFFAAARLSVAAVGPMRDAGWGRIVNVASTYAREPDPSFAAYGAAKAALVNLTKSLARAFSADGVLTNCVIPGVTLTEGVEAAAAVAADRSGSTVEEVLAVTMAKDPVAAGRFGEPHEVSAAICFLASERASWISGTCLAVDGCTLRVAP